MSSALQDSASPPLCAHPPKRPPFVGVCLDGTSMEYLDAASAVTPTINAFRRNGFAGIVRGAMPSFTNPNNLSIACGAPPSVHGLCGNFYYDPEKDEEVMMNDPAYLEAETLFAQWEREGLRVAVVTTKDKLRRLLSKGLRGLCFSVEAASKGELPVSGTEPLFEQPVPGVYDPFCSVACITAGCRLLESGADMLYLTTTDFVQHKYEPDAPVAIEFYRRMDGIFARMAALGAVIGLTADHGMQPKTQADGAPNVRFLETLLHEAGIASRVILPITDPYVVHHGALGSFASVYLDAASVESARSVLRAIPGVESVHTGQEAAAQFELPPQRIGDLIVLGDRTTVLGRTPDWHDLSAVHEGLRSHGGLHENEVPFICNQPLGPVFQARAEAGQLRNFDLFPALREIAASTQEVKR